MNEKEKLTTVDLIANNETELSLYQRLSKRVSRRCQMFVIEDHDTKS